MVSRPSLWQGVVCLAIGFCIASAPAEGAVAQSVGSASIAQDARTGNWSITAAGATLTLSLESARDFQIVGLVGPTGRGWLSQAQSDTTVTVNGVTTAFGRRDGDFQYENTSTTSDGYR